MGERSWKMCQITQGGVARKRQSGSPSFTRHLTPYILSVRVRQRERDSWLTIPHREEKQNGKVEELKNSIVEIRVISLEVKAQSSLLFFYARSTYKFSFESIRAFQIELEFESVGSGREGKTVRSIRGKNHSKNPAYVCMY